MDISDVNLVDAYKVLVLVLGWGLFLTITFRLWGNRPISRRIYQAFFFVPMVLAWVLLGYPLGFQLFVVGGGLYWALKPLEKFLFRKTGNSLHV